jgi:acetyltransferase-like isoleucine patch superfamily enzyme
MEPSEVVSSPDHPWGDAPFHYSEKVYLELVRRLTGAEGRVVWGPRATTKSPTGAVQTTTTGPQPSASSARPTTSPVVRPDPATPLRAGFSVGELVRTTWRLRRSTGTHVVEPIRFNDNGVVWGNSHKTSWAVDDGYLALTNAKGEIITRFDHPVSDHQSFRLEGQFLLEPEKRIIHVLEPTELDWAGRKRHQNLTRTALEKEIARFKWIVGDHTFGKPIVREPRTGALSIGKFSTLGNNVTLYLSSRRTESVSTYPFHSLRMHWPSGDRFSPQHQEDAPLTIGNDVRIGENSMIMPGVTIGDGAVVAPGSIVTQDVQPYAIVSGAPAVETGQRFRTHEIDSLRSLRWWDWPDEKVDEFLPLMAAGIDEFLSAARD